MGTEIDSAATSRFRIAAVLSVGQIGSRAVLAAYFVLLIRTLDRAQYGDLAYATSWLTILIVLADGGYARVLLREVARGGPGRRTVAWELLAARSGWLALTTLLAVAAALLGALHFDAGFTACLFAALVFESASLGFEALAQATDRPWVISVAQLIGGTGLALWGVLLLTAIDVTPLLALAGLAGTSALRLTVQVAFWLRRRPGRLPLPLPSLARARASLREALPYLLLAALAVLYYRIDVVILHGRRGAVETAPYAAAYRAVDAVVIIGGVLFTAIAPHMSRVMLNGTTAVWTEWRRYVTRVAAFAVGVAVALAVFAEPLARLLFGSRYAHSTGENLVLLAPGVAFMLVQTVNAAVVLMSDDKGVVVKLTLANVALNVAMTWILAGAYGARGASIATSVAEVVTFVGFTLVIRSRYRPAAASD